MKPHFQHFQRLSDRKRLTFLTQIRRQNEVFITRALFDIRLPFFILMMHPMFYENSCIAIIEKA